MIFVGKVPYTATDYRVGGGSALCQVANFLELFPNFCVPGICHPTSGAPEGPPEPVPAVAFGIVAIVTPVPRKRCIPTRFASGSQPPTRDADRSPWHARVHRVYPRAQTHKTCHVAHMSAAALAPFAPSLNLAGSPSIVPSRGVWPLRGYHYYRANAPEGPGKYAPRRPGRALSLGFGKPSRGSSAATPRGNAP